VFSYLWVVLPLIYYLEVRSGKGWAALVGYFPRARQQITYQIIPGIDTAVTKLQKFLMPVRQRPFNFHSQRLM
jgi:hypothetical protein